MNEVSSDGRYNANGLLTAGHYEVSFDPKDGKGQKGDQSKLALYTSDTKDMMWTGMSVEKPQHRYEHKTVTNITSIPSHGMHDIPIDWLVE